MCLNLKKAHKKINYLLIDFIEFVRHLSVRSTLLVMFLFKLNVHSIIVSRVQLTYVEKKPGKGHSSKNNFFGGSGSTPAMEETCQPRSKQEILDSLKDQISKPPQRRRGGWGAVKPEQKSSEFLSYFRRNALSESAVQVRVAVSMHNLGIAKRVYCILINCCGFLGW